MIRAATRHIDDMHEVMVDYGWRASVAQGSSDGGFSMDDFHTLQERVSMMRTDYQQLLIDSYRQRLPTGDWRVVS
jgi:hypothetical protein